ncbi:MAG: thiol-disulfide oxidoreductase DCC family protein, partial [Calditrichaeota bacterium]
LVLYDGVCGLCNRTVRWLLRIDRRGILCFAPLQSETAAAILLRHGMKPSRLETLVLVRDGGTPAERLYIRSQAALEICRELGGMWRIVSFLRIVPRPIGDALYNFIARRRYRWFGRHEQCPVPPPEVRQRFLDI